MTMPTTPTVAEKMLSDLEKINKALQEMSFILLYVGKKTHLAQREIQSVFDALKDLNREVQPRK